MNTWLIVGFSLMLVWLASYCLRLSRDLREVGRTLIEMEWRQLAQNSQRENQGFVTMAIELIKAKFPTLNSSDISQWLSSRGASPAEFKSVAKALLERGDQS